MTEMNVTQVSIIDFNLSELIKELNHKAKTKYNNICNQNLVYPVQPSNYVEEAVLQWEIRNNYDL